MLPYLNAILQSTDKAGTVRLERILWENPSGSEVITINIQEKKALPISKTGQEIIDGIERVELRLIQNDPYAFLSKPEESIPETMRKRRDQAWEVIRPLIENHPIDILFKKFRGAIIEGRSKETHVSEVSILLYLRRYWQRGLMPNALLADRYSCGGRGKGKKIGNKKLGRRRKYITNRDDQQGINIDETTRKKLLRGLKKYYGRGEGQYPSFTSAYRRTLLEYFNIGFELRGSDFIPVLPPIETLPSRKQAQYWYNKSNGIEKRTIAREGRNNYNLRSRPLLADSNQMARSGPGSVYQIDSTIGDIYLVSSFDRTRLIGRPVIYMIMDVFSRMIVGMNITVENPSWTGAMVALENALTDKVEFCRKNGININEADWPVHHIPASLIADRGELIGFNADSIPNSMGIRISNTSPYRADWKGIIERNFRQINDNLLHALPGAVRKIRERGDPDYRMAACLDIHQIRKLMIYCVLKHNNSTYLDCYKPNNAMMADRVPLLPIEIWNWGIQNISGILREKPGDIIRINLLPRGEASITEKGIAFRSLHYDCDLARQEGWYIEARQNGRRKITISYDPRSANLIYYFRNDNQQFESCTLLDMDSMFANHDWDEVKDQQVASRKVAESSRTSELQAEAEYQTAIGAITKEGLEQTRSSAKELSKTARLRNMRVNRHAERQRERREQSWTHSERAAERQENPQPQQNLGRSIEEEYVGPPSYAGPLKQQVEERERNDTK